LYLSSSAFYHSFIHHFFPSILVLFVYFSFLFVFSIFHYIHFYDIAYIYLVIIY